ncbi:MAG: CBS domain-containing protein [Gelidibacter sp.]|uniref:CBS domain-containing protein n=1 Tax=Gelidibacter sp. TaxID=2018083 RepID=UPI003266A40F
MPLREYIINDIKPLNINDKVSDLKMMFNELTYSHIPIEKDKVYLGCISETDVHCFEGDKTILDCAHSLEGFFVRAETNWLDVLETFAQHSCNIMPVLDEENNYLGYYELNDIIGIFNDTPFFSEPGGTLIVEKAIEAYSFSEISQIVESNSAKILGAFISKMENDMVQITLKIGSTGLNNVIQTFRRYSYNIISGHEEDTYVENLKERSEYLKKYLNM